MVGEDSRESACRMASLYGFCLYRLKGCPSSIGADPFRLFHNVSSVGATPKTAIVFSPGQFRHKFGSPKLSPQQVDSILRANEATSEFNFPTSSVKYIDTNQLRSNNPIEDRRAEARCLHTTGLMFGMFDGHGGSACVEVIAQRLFSYLAASFLPRDYIERLLTIYEELVKVAHKDTIADPKWNLVDMFHNPVKFHPELAHLYHTSLLKYLKYLYSKHSGDFVFHMDKAMTDAFMHLDAHMSEEAVPSETRSHELGEDTLSIAASGAVACVAHVDGQHLHVASAGCYRRVHFPDSTK